MRRSWDNSYEGMIHQVMSVFEASYFRIHLCQDDFALSLVAFPFLPNKFATNLAVASLATDACRVIDLAKGESGFAG